MPIYRKPEERASETVTVRLTMGERSLLDYLAKVEEKTLTDLIRSLISHRATELGIDEVPEPPKRKRPGRPKKKRVEIAEPPPEEVAVETSAEAPEESPDEAAEDFSEDTKTAEIARDETEEPSMEDLLRATFEDIGEKDEKEELLEDDDVPIVVDFPTEPENPNKARKFRDLVERFREHFSYRAEGTRNELEDTIRFLCSIGDKGPIIPYDMPLAGLTPTRLAEIRDAVQASDLRLARKNRHLTYLRMMLHFAVKEPDIDLAVNPAVDLEPLTLVESRDSWQYFRGNN